MMIPTKTYGPTEKVRPKEENYIIGYTDKDGNDYIGIRPDFEKEPWFNDLIQEDGLEKLCKDYPYQPLKVDKDSGLLVPIFSCDYNAKLTNCFHVIYHMRKDQNMSYKPIKEEPSIDVQESNFVEKTSSVDKPIEGYSPNWSEAYHHETPKIEIHENKTTDFIESEEDQKKKYGIKNMDINILPEEGMNNIPVGWHPNNQPYPSYNPYQTNYMVSNTQPNPYTYNPAYQMNSSYLPQYKTIDTEPIPFMAMEDVEEYMMKARDREQANMEYATKMNLDIKSSNPTCLDTSSNTVDFSNPESVARMQGLYTNPYYNNLNNPNFAAPNNYPYGMSNPYGTIVNPIYNNQYSYNNMYSNPWWNNPNDLSFMEYSEEEIRAKKGFTVKLARVKESESKEKIAKPVKESPKEKRGLEVSILRVKESRKEETKEDKELTSLYQKLENIQRPIVRYRWYGSGYKEQVEQLAKKLMIYDEARSMCLLGSLDDPKINKHEFKLYYRACEEKLQWYQSEEKMHEENDYRVPFRYRKNPKLYTDSSGQSLFQKYTIPMKRNFRLSDGKVIRFYLYDRGRDPNDEEWQEFYDQAIYERKIEIELIKVKVLEEYEQEQTDLNHYNPYNMMDARIHEMKMEEKLRKDQYQVFRDAYGGCISDEQFNKWWYQNTPQPSSPYARTEEDIVAQRQEWKKRMNEQHAELMRSIVPIDLEAVRIMKTNKINQIVRNFDHGTMDTCCSLKDFFDNLGYLNVRVCEENIERQRAEALNASLSVNRYDYSKNLFQMAQPQNWNNSGVNDPYFQNRPHYMEFVNSQDYEEKKHQFFDYCSNTSGVIPLRPIYR